MSPKAEVLAVLISLLLITFVSAPSFPVQASTYPNSGLVNAEAPVGLQATLNLGQTGISIRTPFDGERSIDGNLPLRRSPLESSQISNGPCTISSASESVARTIVVTADCAGASWVKLSESSDFGETAPGGVVEIDITGVAPDQSYADLSISYINAVSQEPPQPFYVQPASKTVNVLAVRYVFEDSGGNIAGLPNYMTDTWLHSMVFGETVGFDGQPTANSIKKHIAHNTYGRVQIAGETYPGLVRLSLERYFDPLDQMPGNRNVLEGITDYIASNDPQFFSGKTFDFLAGFSPDHYSVVGALEGLSFGSISPPPAHPSIRGFIVSQAPITTASVLYGPIVDEPVTSVSLTTVATRYDPISVSGVWIDSDPGHNGTNYFAGGQLVGSRGNRHLELGVPLPGPQTPVIVSYTPSAAQRVSPSTEAWFPPDSLILPGDRWHSRYMHELYHAISGLISFNGLLMGDLYKEPARLERYDLMDDGEDNRQLDSILGDGVMRNYYEPSYLSGYSRMAGDLVHPYTLGYGNSTSSIRLYKSEESDFSHTNERIKLIKIPLRPIGDPGLQSMLKLGNDRQYDGEEYLLLEWRYRGQLGGNDRNFDKYLPSEGLAISHVIQNPHYNGTNTTGFGNNIVRVVDATPPPLQEEGYTDTEESPALFGPGSGVYSYQAGAYWQELSTGQGSLEYLLSEGAGNKTLYAKFKDGQGNLLGQDQVSVFLEDDSTAEERMPNMAVVSPGDNSVVTADPTRVTIDVDAPNGVVRTFVYHDGAEATDSTGERTVDFIRLNEFSGNGFHRKGYVGYDRAGIPFTTSLPFYINQGPGPNLAPVAHAGTDQTLSDVNEDGVVTVVLDGRQSSDHDGVITNYQWFDGSGALLSTEPVHALEISSGAHAFTLRVTDNQGSVSTDSVQVNSAGGPVPPAAPTGLAATAASSTRVDLIWTDNSFDEDLVEVQRSNDGSIWSLIATLGEDAVSYSDVSVIGGETYHYRVRTVNAGGMSPYSNVVTVVTPGPIFLNGTGTKVKGLHVVGLNWQGAQSSDVEIHRAGAPFRLAPNSGSFTDETGGRGKNTYEYWICEAGNPNRCSNSILIEY